MKDNDYVKYGCQYDYILTELNWTVLMGSKL